MAVSRGTGVVAMALPVLRCLRAPTLVPLPLRRGRRLRLDALPAAIRPFSVAVERYSAFVEVAPRLVERQALVRHNDGKIDPHCFDCMLPFDARFLDGLQLSRISDVDKFQQAVDKVFEDIDNNKDGMIDRCELERLLRERIYPTCPREVWAVTPEQLLQRMGATGPRISRDEFVRAVERVADTLDRRVWPLATSQLFSTLMVAASQPLTPLLVKELGITMTQFGGMVAMMPIIRLALSVPTMYVANVYGRKPLTVLGQMVSSIGMCSAALIATPLQLILCRAVYGAGNSFTGVGQQSMLGDIATGRTRSRVFAPGAVRSGAAFAVGPVLGGWLAATFGVQASFLFCGAGMAAVSLRNRYFLTETLRKRFAEADLVAARQDCTSRLERLKAAGEKWRFLFHEIDKDRDLRAVMLAYTSFNFTLQSSRFVMLPMLVLDTWGLGASGLGLVMGCISVLQLAASKPAANVADIYGRRMALLPGLVLSTAAMLAAACGLPMEVAAPLVIGTWAVGSAFVESVPAAMALDAAGRRGLDQRQTSQLLAISRGAGDLGMAAGAISCGALLNSFGVTSAFGLQGGLLAMATVHTAFSLRNFRR